MSKCSKCGCDVNEGVAFCSKCGNKIEMQETKNEFPAMDNEPKNTSASVENEVYGTYNMQSFPNTTNSAQYNQPVMTEDKPNIGLNILAWFIPIVGFILWGVWKDKTPRKAKSIGKTALISAIVNIVLAIIVSIIVFVGTFSLVDNIIDKIPTNEPGIIYDDNQEDDSGYNDSDFLIDETKPDETTEAITENKPIEKINAKLTSATTPAGLNEWATYRKYFANEHQDYNASVRVTKVTRNANAIVKDYLDNGNSIYKYTEPNVKEGFEDFEWVVFDVEVDMTGCPIPSYGIGVCETSAVTSCGNKNAVVYNGRSYYLSNLRMPDGDDVVKTERGHFRIAATLPKDYTDYVLEIGYKDITAFIKPE